MTDRHKSHPQTVRMPGGLRAWYQERADATGEPVNALLVAALEDGRRRHESGSTTADAPAAVAPPRPGRGQKAKAGPPPGRVPFREPAPEEPAPVRKNCTHPGVIKGVCHAPGCGVWVGRKR